MSYKSFESRLKSLPYKNYPSFRDYWFDRAVHKIYAEPNSISRYRFIDSIYKRVYWSIRGIQYKLFFKDEEMDIDEIIDKWEIGVQPPPLERILIDTNFKPKWVKYMYARFKNESPNGVMREEEFKRLLAGIIAPEKSSDLYIRRLFHAFAGPDKEAITFHTLIENLAYVHPQSPENNARWTIKLITAGKKETFTYNDFYDFTQSVFLLNEGAHQLNHVENRESIRQRASTVFQELDADGDGIVTHADMCRFFERTDLQVEQFAQKSRGG